VWTHPTTVYQNSVVVKGIVHFEINFWYVLAYLEGIQDVGVICFRSSFNFDITKDVYQKINFKVNYPFKTNYGEFEQKPRHEVRLTL